jgi:hypothetical protein
LIDLDQSTRTECAMVFFIFEPHLQLTIQPTEHRAPH